VFDPADSFAKAAHEPGGIAPQSDAALMTRVQRGETELFAELVGRYQPALRRVARSRLGRLDWAEDVVQETFLAAFKSRATFDARFSFRTWLWTILLNQCHGHYQRRLRSVPVEPLTAEYRQEVSESGASSVGAPLSRLLAKERSEQLEFLLGRLTLVQADALRLRFFGELKFHEIADAMQCSLNTAKNRVRMGLQRMAELLETAGAQGAQRRPLEQESSEL
jgi:RNA polymerase sigma-70 factor (ECF subfamily)